MKFDKFGDSPIWTRLGCCVEGFVRGIEASLSHEDGMDTRDVHHVPWGVCKPLRGLDLA